MSLAIHIEDVSKLYRLGMVGTGTIADDLNRWWARIRGKEDPYAKVGQLNDRAARNGQAETTESDSSSQTSIHKSLLSRLSPPASRDYVWALKDINLEIEQGEILGIIGRNGAGKSTLLKLLSRVTAPTTGEIRTRGRIASLLEVGTGFHPELTGRENIYLNGAILGMKRHEITKQFDTIVDFSGCAKYVDTPVKRYSSGMMVRLGFAVAAHLECEVLIVDEVLAVGDADFQKKCIGKMRDVSTSGRTILLVSHNMGSISSLCSRAVLLDQGNIIDNGPTSDVVITYLHGERKQAIREFIGNGPPIGDQHGVLRRAWVADSSGTAKTELRISEGFTVNMEFELLVDTPQPPRPNFHFFDARGEYAFYGIGDNYDCSNVTAGVYVASCRVPPSLMNDGTYFIGISLAFIHRGVNVCFFERDALSIHVSESLEATINTTRCGYGGPIPGAVRPALQWQIKRTGEERNLDSAG